MMLLYLENLWDLFVDMSFYIVIGLIFTGLLHAFVKKDAILKHIGKDNTSSVVKASVLGVPLPLCSCGVVPTAMYLGKSGASKGSVVSFLTSTPQTGVDSIIATYGMMGPLFAVYRAVSAFFSGIISGVVTNLFCKHDHINYGHAPVTCACSHDHKEEQQQHEHTSCCSHEHKEEQQEHEHTSCCSHEHKEEQHQHEHISCCSHEHKEEHHQHKESFASKMKRAFDYAFGEFLDEIAVHFVVGLLIAALISTLLPESLLASFSNPLVSMLLMVVIGIPMYICSTASIPIAVSLIMKGVSPGAAFVFLFAGPVTNVASLAILVKTLGKKVTAIYLASAAICAIAFGLLLDYIIEVTGYSGITNLIHHSHEHEMPFYMTVIAVIFGALVLKSLFKNFSSKSTQPSCACGH